MLTYKVLIMSGLVSQSIAGYTLTKSYTVRNFFQEFDFFTGKDPTNGAVQYVDLTTANQSRFAGSGSLGNFSNLIYLGVDSEEIAPSGRQSTRVTSKDTFDKGLFIADIVHSPSGICGTWPAFWLLGEGTWPQNGEIDIMEGVNDENANQITLHTSSGCSNTVSSGYTGSQLTSDCTSGDGNNTGCAIQSKDQQTYGDVFNENFGGVFATEWTDDAIKVWFWPRDNIPSDVLRSQPSPDENGWGQPQAIFSGGCDIDAHFRNMQLIIDTTFCGDWAGKTWSASGCSTKAPTCEQWVENNPGAFAEAYWAISVIEVYSSS